MSQEEIELISVLEKCIPTWGRYPIPTDVDELTNEEILNIKTKKLFEDLFDKLHNNIEEILKHEWKGPHGCILREHSVSDLESGINFEIVEGILNKKDE